MGFTAVETRTLHADVLGETVGHRGARPGTWHRHASCKSKLLARTGGSSQLTTGAVSPALVTVSAAFISPGSPEACRRTAVQNGYEPAQTACRG